MQHKRRALVLTDETARHWFLRSLPPHVRRSAPRRRDGGDVVRSGPAITSGDWRMFLTAYCTAFFMVSAFIL